MSFNIYISIVLILATTFFPLESIWATNELGSIRGSSINKSSGNSISNAKVTLIQNGKILQTVTTNDDGTFILQQVSAGIYDLSCHYPGFVPQKIVGIEIRENHVKLAFFKLSYGDASNEELIMTHASLQVLRERAQAASSKTETNVADLPATIYVYTQEDIAERGYMHLSEILQDVPQLEVNERSSFSDYNTISSRGIAGNEKLLVLINGVRITSMTLTSHALDKAFSVRYAERVEVILGPSSSTYEADAFVGVVNIIMPSGIKTAGGALSSSYGMYNTTENALMATFGKGKVGGTITASCYNSKEANLAELYPIDFNWYHQVYKNSGEVLDNVFSNDLLKLPIVPYSTPQEAYSVQAHFKIYDFEVGMSHHSQKHSSATGVSPQYTIYGADNQSGFINNNAYIKHIAKAKKKKNAKKTWSLESLINWNNYMIRDDLTTQNAYTHYIKAHRAGHDNNIRLRETFNYKIKSSKIHTHNILAGLYGRYSIALPKTSYTLKEFNRKLSPAEQDIYYIGSDILNDDGNSLKFTQITYNTNQFNVGGFAQYGLKIKDFFSFSLGLRVDFIQSQTQSASTPINSYLTINPRATFVLKPHKHFRIKLFYAEAALPPPLNRQYDHYGTLSEENNGFSTYLQGHLWRIPSDSLLSPEKVRSVELEGSFSQGNLLIIGSGYFSHGENLIRDKRLYNKPFLDSTISTSLAIQANNSAEAFLYGGTIYASYRLVRGNQDQFSIKADAAYTFADGITNGLKHIPFTAKHTIKAGLVLRYKFLSISARLLYRSISYNEGYADEDGIFVQYGNQDFVTLNLFLKGTIYQNKKSGLQVDLFSKIYNVTDARYYHTTDNNPISMGASPQAPILVLGGLNFKFLR